MRLVIVGTGGMANSHAKKFGEIEGVNIVGGVDRNEERLTAFCDEHNIEKRFTSLEDALAWGEFDAVANVTPDAVHHPTTMPLLAAGKHVFCEKPLASNFADADEMATAADQAGLINMVNLSYRDVSALQKAHELIAAGEIGEIRHFEASYLQSWLTQPAWGHWDKEEKWLWRLSESHGSLGVLGDVGIHILDFAGFAIGAPYQSVSCHLKTFDKAPGNQIGEYKLDANDSFTMMAETASGAVGVVHASRFASGHMNDLHLQIHGTKGGIKVTNTGDLGELFVCSGPNLEKAEWEQVELNPTPNNYRKFAEAVKSGVNGHPTFRHAANLQQVLDLAVESSKAGGRKDIPLSTQLQDA